MLTKAEISEVVSVFYQPKFKAYYINASKNGTAIHPIGVFISLGITTTLGTLNYVKESIEALGKYRAYLCEIKSKEVNGRYLNSISRLGEEEIQDQYEIVDLPINVLNKEQAKLELVESEKMNSNQTEVLKKLIEKIDEGNGWERHAIQKDGNGYILYHKFVNYRKDDAYDYRIGLFIAER